MKFFLILSFFAAETIYSSQMNYPQKRRKPISNREQIKDRIGDLTRRNSYERHLLEKLGFEHHEILYALKQTVTYQELMMIKAECTLFDDLAMEIGIEDLDYDALKAKVNNLVRKDFRFRKICKNIGLSKEQMQEKISQADHHRELLSLGMHHPEFHTALEEVFVEMENELV